ncbi:MAG: hypothetical protein L0220_24225, partial [Acidobacteria bacterium]|nr:hypothetical protein [Acidobacteriota bacterium]
PISPFSHPSDAGKLLSSRIWSKIILSGQGDANSAIVEPIMQSADTRRPHLTNRKCSTTIPRNVISLSLRT